MKAKRIFCIVAYDFQEDKRRNKVSKLLEKYGVRVNFSVFECMFTERQFEKVKEDVNRLVYSKEDTVIFYPVCVNCFTKIVYQPERRKVVRTIQIV